MLLIGLSMYTIYFHCGMYFLVFLYLLHLTLHACILTLIMDIDYDLWIRTSKVYSKFSFVSCLSLHVKANLRVNCLPS